MERDVNKCAHFGPGFDLSTGDLEITKVHFVEVLSREIDAASVVARLREVAEKHRRLSANEHLVFLYGYDASCRAAGLAHRESGGALGPDLALFSAKARAAAHPPRLGRDLALGVPRGARAKHVAAVKACLEEIVDGVCYQANLAHPISVDARSRAEALDWYFARARPSFSAFLPLGEFGDLISLSPECFLRFDLEQRWARAYPIKGTLPRNRDPEELHASDKDRAEHMMIVDLLRNDLARVSDRVTVERLLECITLPNVYHLESCVRGDLLEGLALDELMVATAPGGSITGAPKSSACDVIAALEGAPRGPYTGVLGVLSAGGRGSFSILIRTWIRPEGRTGTLHVGGGIVADSEPAAEWEETLAKARAFGEVTS